MTFRHALDTPSSSPPEPRLFARVGVFLGCVLPAWTVFVLLYGTFGWERIVRMEFPGPDDLLRMVEVRDWLNGQGWFDVSQHRMNLSGGGPMHWSRLVDLPIAFFIELLRPLVGAEAAQAGAAAIVPLLTFLVFLTLLARFADRLFGRRIAMIACLMACLTLPIAQQFQVYRVDHHGWQIVCTMLIMLGVFSPDARRGGWLVGAAAALWLVISMEGLPMVIGTIIVLGLGWLFQWRGDREGLRFQSTVTALASVGSVLWIVTRFPQGGAVYCDALSLFHLATFAAAAVGVFVTRRFGSGIVSRFLGLAVTASICAAILGVPAPQCVTGAFNTLPPLVHKYWYENVAEGLPIWRQSRLTAVGIFMPIALAFVGLGILWRVRPERRDDWAVYLGLFGVAACVSMLVARAGGETAAITLAPAAFAFLWLLRGARRIPGMLLRTLATSAALLLLLSAPLLPVLFADEASKPENGTASASRYGDCLRPKRLREVGSVLDGLGRGRNVLAPLNIGPALLFSTDVTIVASGYHRNKIAINDVIRFWMGSPGQALAIVRARNSDYVLFCPGIPEPRMYSKAAPTGMMARLLAGDAPGWLVPVDDPRLGSMKVYRVDLDH